MTGKEAGLTLMELLIALAVAAILTSVAYPSYQAAVGKVRITDSQRRLQESITASMRYALRTRRNVVMCPSLDGSSCVRGSDWSSGWISFVDLDRDRERSPEEPLVGSPAKPAERIRVTSNTGRPRIAFRANGTNPGSNATFTICDPGSRAAAAALIIANSGQLRRSSSGTNLRCEQTH